MPKNRKHKKGKKNLVAAAVVVVEVVAVIEETFNKVNTHKGIEGIILSDAEGVPIKSTFNEEEKTYFYTTSASMFVKKCRNVVKELIEEDLTFIRIRTKLNEIMIAPENDFIFIVVQNPAANN